MTSTAYFVDSHCHFDLSAFDADRDEVWRSCNALGVQQLVIPGVSPEQWQQAAALAQTYPGIFFSAGLHPWWVAEWLAQHNPPSLDLLAQQLMNTVRLPACVAIGECGLDAAIATPLDAQLPVLELQLEIASQTGLPVIIHCRKAHSELMASLKRRRLPRGGVIHAFSGSTELAQQYWALGFYLGIGGTITYPRANKTRMAVKHLPLESILLETDAPDMPLSGKQGQRNSPEYLPQVAQTMAQLRAETPATIAAQTTANAHKLFGFI